MKNKIRLGFLIIVLSTALTACRAGERESVAQAGADRPAAAAKPETESANIAPQSSPTPEKKEAPKVVFDGRTDVEGIFQSAPVASSPEKSFVAAEVAAHEAAIKQKVPFECDDESELSIVSVAEGAFTKAGARQKAYLYELCRAGRAFGIGGLLVAENGKTVAHYAYGENGLDMGIFSFEDFNRNGLTEIVVLGGGGGQGYFRNVIEFYEIGGGVLDFMGRAEVYADNSGAALDDAKVLTEAYRISVRPDKNPVFYREKFEKKSGKDWISVKKDEKFAPEKAEAPKWVRIG